MDKLNSEQWLCQVCQTSCEIRCSSCNKVSYCSKEHQKEDKVNHKEDCFPAVVRSDKTLGRYLMATRDIKQGEIILKEKPILTGPSSAEAHFPICLGCYRVVRSRYKCSTCLWPVCGLRCEKKAEHAEFECKLFAKQVPPADFEQCMKENMYDNIKILRCLLLKTRDPKKWQQIMCLESHVYARTNNEKAQALTSSAIHFIQKKCSLNQFDDETIDYISGILGVNCYGSDEREATNPKFRAASYLFYNGSMTAHDCVPNSFWVIQLDSELNLRASIPIKAGQTVTQLYVQCTLNTKERRSQLLEGHYFHCNCKRCSDPTELNTFFSSVKCTRCPDGYLLQTKPLDEKSEWKCNSNKCGITKPNAFVSFIVEKVKSAQDAVNYEDSLQNIDRLEKIVQQYSGSTVHSQHYLIHGIEYDILQRISYALMTSMISKVETQSVQEERLVELCLKCLDIADVIWPGHSRHRGRLLYYLQQGMTYVLLRKVSSKPLKIPEAKKLLEELYQKRKQGCEILGIEPEGRDEFMMVETMTNDTRELKAIKRYLKM